MTFGIAFKNPEDGNSNMSRRLLPLIILLFVIVLPLICMYVDYLWFQELGFESIFTTILTTRIGLFFLAGAGFFALSMLGTKFGKNKIKHLNAILLIVSVVVGIISSVFWETVLSYFNSTPFGTVDPIFGMDLSFYFFQLPFYNFIWALVLGAIFFSGILSVGVNLKSLFTIENIKDNVDGVTVMRSRINSRKEFVKTINKIQPIVGMILIILAVGIFLRQYDLVYSQLGTVKGAGWTDVNIMLPFIYALSISLLVAGILFIFKSKFGIMALVGIVVIAVLGNMLILVAQGIVVSPDEFNKEQEFLERNIEFTNKAFGLDKINVQSFPAEAGLTMADINNNPGIMKNIRLWDWRPLLQTYKQIQLIRTYYDFADADVDRYEINGEYKQVIVSAREINSKLIPERSWINEHLVFTHGHGLTMTPVRETDNGLPLLYIKDIPSQSNYFELERPEIYFGELTNDYVITNTLTEELDYPLGDKNVYTVYQGSAGIPLTLMNRFAIAACLKSSEILFSGSLTSDSKILLNRNIMRRVNELAPFITYDSDPYVVFDDGRLFWMIDGYTISDRYPYSEEYYGFNYIRNSVKVVIDAYNGDTTFYVMEDEPMIKTYMKIFPDLFVSVDDMPTGLKKHVRYPEDIFTIQQEVFSKYHMKDSRVFYNKEDLWDVPREMYQSNEVDFEPYYLIVHLPGEVKEEFALLQAFTPKSKNNIVAWMAARSDENYGEIMLYTFSKEKFITGPMQLEARIDQDAEISQLFSLWSQGGSNVIRGHITILPIENSLLYIEPIYLRASQEAALPELTRVIVSHGDKIVMEENLDKALQVLFGGRVSMSDVSEDGIAGLGVSESSDIINSSQEALGYYNEAQDALAKGDWAEYGKQMGNLEDVLESMSN